MDDAALAPQPDPARVPAEPAATTGTITVVEPAVTDVRETPKEMPAPLHRPAPAAQRGGRDPDPDPAPTPLVPPPLNEPRRR
jgi:hypothetical protein